jgi:hypothetical protein
MKRTILLVACAVTALAAASFAAEPPTASDRLLKLATTRLEQGEREMSRARKLTTNSAKLDAWDRAIVRLRQARETAWKGTGASFEEVQKFAYAGLVRSLTAEAEIYFAKKSLPLAKKRNDAALDLDPNDARARNLAVMIRDAEEADIYDVHQGATAVNRIRDRRAAVGLPLRDRGVSTRR